ncbi:hypothetical protein KXV55_005847 [Aspergillus fumigatus]|nr:hypothetical protein KXV55_005847 [Aspergillus fumigatus]
MGLTESRIISGKLTVACFEADSQGRHGIHNLLDDDEFISNLRTLWKQIPLSQKRRIQSVGTTSKKAPAKLEQSVSESLIKSTPQWKKDPQSFFSEGGTVQLGLQYPVAESYNFVLQLEERGEKNTWRIRFLKIVFSRLLAKVCSGYRRTKDIKRAITIIQASGIVGHNAKLIEEHILSWSDIGRRLESLCEDLFYGYKGDPTGDGDVDRRARGRDEKHLCMLFCLPHFVNQDYLKKLPFSGPNRTQKLKILEEIGAVTGGQDSSLGQLACDIFKFLWDPVQQSLVREDFIQQIPPGQSTYDTPSRGNGTQRSLMQTWDYSTRLKDLPTYTSENNQQGNHWMARTVLRLPRAGTL